MFSSITLLLRTFKRKHVMNDRKQWLLRESSLAMRKAREAATMVKSFYADMRHTDKQIAIVSDMLDTARRETVYVIPHDVSAFRRQCVIHGISVELSGIGIDMFYIDLTKVSEKTRKHIIRFIREMSCHLTVSTDTDVSYGATARLSPTTQKMKASR